MGATDLLPDAAAQGRADPSLERAPRDRDLVEHILDLDRLVGMLSGRRRIRSEIDPED
jgi:hypothetical protein